MTDKKIKPEYLTPQTLHDWPLKKDQDALFNFDDFAATLARLIASRDTKTPLTIGVSGRWGSGKTTLLRRVERMLEQTQVLYDPAKPALMDFGNPEEVPQALFRPCRTVWFNAWKYADEEQLLVALVRVIVQEMSRDDLVSKVLGKLLDPSYPRRDVVNTVLGWFSVKVGEAQIGLNTGQPVPTAFAEKTALLDLFDEAFDKLMAAWVQRKMDAEKIDPAQGVLVVIIDDLDRCLPPKMIQVLEAVKLFMDKEGCVFLLGADTEIVRRAVEKQYEAAGVSGQGAGDYLEKIVQLRFELPPSTHTTMQAMLNGEAVIGADWGDSWRLLITGAEINPRKVKTFVNDLNLQWAMLVNSGQAQGVDRADFNTWQVLARIAPRNFLDQIRERLDDLELRHQFVLDAIKWARGDESLNATFQQYDSWRLRRVLKDITFGQSFDAQTLDAFVHLVAPPEKPKPAEEKPALGKEEGQEEAKAKGLETFNLEPETQTDEALTRGLGPKAQTPSREGARFFAGVEFMLIPTGKFIMGSKDDDKDASDAEKPQHTLDISYDYWLARFPVTNAEYDVFLKATGGSHPVSGWQEKKDHPVVSVPWNDAQKFVAWLNEIQKADLPAKYAYRLPSEAEWEKAARGAYGNIYPWGNDWDPKRCNSSESKIGGTTPVAQYPSGESPYGVMDMSGNTWEWTRSLWDKYPYPSELKERLKREDENAAGSRVVRGGSFNSVRRDLRCAYRNFNLLVNRFNLIGFRVCVSPIS
jgi:formylglycine-generating enzyme required for sulfatase activity